MTVRNKETATFLSFLFSIYKGIKHKTIPFMKNKKGKKIAEERNSFYDSLSNLLLMNESLFRSSAL